MQAVTIRQGAFAQVAGRSGQRQTVPHSAIDAATPNIAAERPNVSVRARVVSCRQYSNREWRPDGWPPMRKCGSQNALYGMPASRQALRQTMDKPDRGRQDEADDRSDTNQIVAQGYGYGPTPRPAGPGRGAAAEDLWPPLMKGLIRNSLVKEVVPFIDKNYRTVANKDNRAIAGLSNGGMHTVQTTNNPGAFGWIAFWNAGGQDTPEFKRRWPSSKPPE